MSDRVIFKIENLAAEVHRALAVSIDSSESKKGPLKLAEPSVLFPSVEYLIESKGDDDPSADRDLQVEFAAPSALMGSNVVLQNDPYEAVRLALKNIQVNLRRRGFDHAFCQQVRLSACELVNAEFTYCFLCISAEEARKLLAEVSFRAHAIHGEKAYSVTSCDRETVYVNQLPEGTLTIYIKSLRHKKTVFEVQDGATRNALELLAPCLVRIEFVVNGRTLSKGIPSLDNNRKFGRRVQGWQYRGVDDSPEEPVFNFIRKALRLDRPLSSVRINPRDLDILQPYQDVLKAYFDGLDPRDHEYFAHLEGDKLSKRFSACKQDIYKVGKFDITIPWVKAQALATDGLAERLTFDKRFRIPGVLKVRTFTPEGVTAAEEGLDGVYTQHGGRGGGVSVAGDHAENSTQPPSRAKHAYPSDFGFDTCARFSFSAP